MSIVTRLQTRPLPRLVPDDVFDAFAWHPTDWIEWRRPDAQRFDASTPIDGSDPARMVFVFHALCTFLPQELARLHAFGLHLEDELALAPYAIDDATDELFARRVSPRSLLWLAADNLNALFWGLHDWAHFHSHGSFDQRAWTELQCDVSAYVWLKDNRDAIGLDDTTLDRARSEIVALIASRFEPTEPPLPRDILSRIDSL